MGGEVKHGMDVCEYLESYIFRIKVTENKIKHTNSLKNAVQIPE